MDSFRDMDESDLNTYNNKNMLRQPPPQANRPQSRAQQEDEYEQEQHVERMRMSNQ